MIRPVWLEFAEREARTGIREQAGERHHDRILDYHGATTLRATADEVPWCLDEYVEILTDRGWRRISEVSAGSPVAQVWPGTLGVELAPAIDVIHKRHRGRLVEFQDQRFHVVTDRGHRWLTRYRRNDRRHGLLERTSEQLCALAGGLIVPTAVSLTKASPAWSDRDLRLAAAWLSDGASYREGRRVFQRRANPGRLLIQVSRNKKRQLLEQLGPVHRYEAQRAYGASQSSLTSYEFEIPHGFAQEGLLDKRPLWSWLWSLSRDQLRVFLESYARFDGSVRGDSRIVYSSRRDLIDWLSAAVALAGWCSSAVRYSQSPLSSRPCFRVRWSTSKQSLSVAARNIRAIDGDSDLHCVTVPSGFILCRDRRGRPFVTGNCASFVSWCLQQAGVPSTRSARARSYLEWGMPLAMELSWAHGAIAVLRRGGGGEPGPDVVDAPGHVGFLVDAPTPDEVLLLGGNQQNAVNVRAYPNNRVLGIRWPDLRR